MGKKYVILCIVVTLQYYDIISGYKTSHGTPKLRIYTHCLLMRTRRFFNIWVIDFLEVIFFP